MGKSMEAVAFYGNDLLATKDENGQIWVAIRQACQDLGVRVCGQQYKIKADPTFAWSVRYSVGADGKNREMLCLPLTQFNFWLATINPNKIKPSSKEKLRLYKLECCDALYQHFMVQGGVHGNVTPSVEAPIQKVQEDMNARFAQVGERFKAIQEEMHELQDDVQVMTAPYSPKETRKLVNQTKGKLLLDGRGYCRSRKKDSRHFWCLQQP